MQETENRGGKRNLTVWFFKKAEYWIEKTEYWISEEQGIYQLHRAVSKCTPRDTTKVSCGASEQCIF